MDLQQAKLAVADPATKGPQLQSIAAEHPELWVPIAAHPNAYPKLLNWMQQYGDEAAKTAVASRLAADAEAAAAVAAGQPMMPLKKPSRKLLVAIVAGVVAVALVVAGIIFVPRLGSGGLKVNGDAPGSSSRLPTFLDGSQVLATLDHPVYDIADASADIALLSWNTDVRQTSAIDLATGQTLWSYAGDCNGIIDGQWAVCHTGDPMDWYGGTYEWVDVSSAISVDSLDTSMLGAHTYDYVNTSQGELIIGGDRDIYTGDFEGHVSATIGYYKGPGKPVWTTDVQFNYEPDDFYDALDEGSGLLSWSAVNSSYVLDEATGFLVYQDQYGFPQIFANRVVYVSTFITSNTADSQRVDVPGGNPVTIHAIDNDYAYLQDFNNASHPDVVFMSDESPLSATNPSDGSTMWQSASDWPVIDSMVWDGAQTAYALGDNGRVWAFDVSTGNVLWWSSIPGYSATQGQRIYLSDSLVVVSGFIDENANYQMGSAFFRADNGQPLTDFNSYRASSAYLVGGVLVVSDDYSAQVIVPAFSDRVAALLTAPADMPSCPTGMSVVSWTKYDTGSVLVCAGATYAVILTDSAHPNLRATQLSFDPSGTMITCNNGTVIYIGAGGSVVMIDSKGQLTTHAATQAWTPGLGQVSYPTAPDGIASCPTGTWPISLSTWNGGWLLVCGTDLATPTWLGFSDGSQQGTSSDVTATDSSYCATLDAGRVCGYAAPALVTLTPEGGDVKQYSVDSNYFPGSGAGGTGLGTGGYGVDVPTTDSPQEQARYLEQVLQASARARSDLKSVMNHLNNKIATDQDIATLQSVVDARNQQIAVIDGAPVTALPDGQNLLSKLRQALVVSEQTDELYVQWARYIQEGDWENADATIAQWRGPAHQSDVLKQAFCTQWNRDIAPAYGVSKFSASQI